MRKYDLGRSTLEMLGVLAIIGVLTIGGLEGYQRGMAKFKVKKTLDQIAEISTNIRTLYMQQESYTGLNNASAAQMMVLPLDMGTGDVLFNPFRGYVTIGTGVASRNDAFQDKAFYLIYDKINRQSCVEIASADWSGKGVNLVALGIFGGETERSTIEELAKNVYEDYEGYAGDYGIATQRGSVLSLPIPTAKAAELCHCPNQALTCTIFWKYY